MPAQLAKGFWSSVDRLAQKGLRLARLSSRRLVLCFGVIVLSMVAADAFILWKLQMIRAEAMRLSGIQDKLNAIYDVHTSVSTLHDRLKELADSEDTARVLQDAGPLEFAVRDQVQRAKTSLMQLPPEVSRDPTIVPTLDDIYITLQAQLEEIKILAVAHDWVAIRRRLDTQIRPLEFLSSDLVAKVDHEVGMEEAQSVEKTRAAELRAFYRTNWFLVLCAAVFLALLWVVYQWRIWQLRHQFEMTLEARVGERTRIARDLHDTLLQSFQAVLPRLQVVLLLMPDRPLEAQEKLESTIDGVAKAIAEGRDAVQGLRDSSVQRNDFAVAIKTLGDELASDSTSNRPDFEVVVEGQQRGLHPILSDEVYRIAAEALRNAFRHAQARRVEVEIRYDDDRFRLHVRDDGKGIDSTVLDRQGKEGHFGLSGMRERANVIGGKLTIWSEVDAGTEVELTIPGSTAYSESARDLSLSRKLAGKQR